MILMTHPDHGQHIAYSEQEVQSCRANGWVTYVKPVEPLIQPSPFVYRTEGYAPVKISEYSIPLAEVETEMDRMREAYLRTFGKPAHHRKSLETLRKELA